MRRPSTHTIVIPLLGTLALACDANLTPPAEGVDAGNAEIACLPNLDGQIEAFEVPVTLHTPVDFYVSPDGTAIDLVGQVDEDGKRVWDFSEQSPSDARVQASVAPLAEKWYASSFPGGEFVLPTDFGAGSNVDGIYSVDDDGLWLYGVASSEPEPAAGTTLLPYDEPVALYRFPLAPGDAWTEVGTLTNGELAGLPYNGTDTYEVEVDGTGRLELPYISFEQTHRIRIRVVVAPAVGGVTTSRRQVSFLFECFGEVAQATSRVDEPDRDFTTAAELRRLAL